MHYDSIDEMSRRIRARTVSPVEILQACVSRIEALNPTLNAFISVTVDAARDDAKAAESEVLAGRWRGPLHGIPVAVKDFFDTAGVRTTAGFEQLRDRVPDRDADVVMALQRAGAIVIGKTNMDSLGMATTGLTSCFGPVRNPWNLEYVPGGSSAGSAVAVSVGMCFATVDTDAVGSARIPAACCGVVGFKGGYGLISTKGILGDQPVDDFIRWMGHTAVTTRRVADAALMLDALTDSGGANCAAALATINTNVRVGVADNVAAAPQVRLVFNEAVAALRTAGYVTSNASVPFGDSGQSSMANVEVDRGGIVDSAFRDIDVIVLPTLGSSVPTVADVTRDPKQGISAETTAFANYYGLPAVSVPCGFDSHNLPVGLQVVGRPGDERTVLNVAHRFQQTSVGRAQHPLV